MIGLLHYQQHAPKALFPAGLSKVTDYAETQLQPSTAKGTHNIIQHSFFLWGYNIHNCVYDRRGNKLFREQNEGNLFLFFSLHLLLHYSSSASPISCRIHNKPPYHLTAFASPPSFSYLQLPSAISKLPSKYTPCPLVLPSLPLLGWPAKHRAQRPAVLQARLDRAKSWNCSGFSSSEGHQQWPSQAPSRRKVVSLSLPVCQVCLKLAELSRVDRWTDDDSWLWQHDYCKLHFLRKQV